MIELERYVLWISAIAALSLGFVMVARRSMSLSTRLLFLLETIACSVWAFGLAIFISETNANNLAWIVKIYYVAAAMIAWSWLPLAYSFMAKQPKKIALVSAVSAIPFAMLALAILFGNNFLVELAIIGQYNDVMLNGFGYTVYCACFIAYCALATLFLFIGYYKANSALEKVRYKYIIGAYFAAFLFGVIFNMILPWLGDYSLVWVGPTNIAIFSAVIYVAIMRYHLFNIKLGLARAVSTITIVIISAVVYGIISVTLFKRNNVPINLVVLSSLSLLALVMLSFMAIKLSTKSYMRWFGSGLLDEDLLSNISKGALSSTNPRSAMKNIAVVLSKHLRSGEAASVVTGRDGVDNISANISIQPEVMNNLKTYMDSRNENELITEELELEGELYDSLRAQRITAVSRAKLSQDVEDDYEACYIIVMDQRQRLYSLRETKVLSSVAGISSLAIQNTLHYDKTKTFNNQLRDEIDSATSSLRIANRKLRKLDESKDDFISMASHQLRTPLTSVRGYIAMLLEGDFGKLSKDQKHVLHEAYSSSERMAFLISDFLDVSRLQTGKFELQKSLTNINELLSLEVAQLRTTAKARNIDIEFEPSIDLPPTDIDRNKIRQVMMNMIDNALYYSKPESKVRIDLYQQNGQIVFAVKDKGIGVPKAEQPKLFTKFYRATNAKRVRPDGTGIGLYMAKKVVVAHGGSIIFESHENLGSTFGFKLPIV